MNKQNGPLSPASLAGSEWSGMNHYQSNHRPYSPSIQSNNNLGRGNLATPPVSGSSNGMNGRPNDFPPNGMHGRPNDFPPNGMNGRPNDFPPNGMNGRPNDFPPNGMNGRPNDYPPNGMNGRPNDYPPNGMNGRPNDYRNNPSPPASIARSSNGTTMSSDAQRRKQPEIFLGDHYIELKGFLAKTLNEEQNSGKPNRARDKLLRLSAVQFQELSTDVYDELLRRKSFERLLPQEQDQQPGFLLPKENFHPKRNQARQKLSTLPIARFTALATDVFFELERRFPRFPAGDIPRQGSPANSMRGPPSRAQTPNGARGDSRERQRRPAPPRQGSLGGQVFAGLGIPGMNSQDDYSKPTPKSSQQNTIVPNKSYLVEDDDDPEYTDDVYGMNKRDTQQTTRSAGEAERDRKMIADYQAQVSELESKVGNLENQLRAKDATIGSLESGRREYEEAGNEWSQLQRDLEGKLEEALKLNDNLQSEIEKVKSYHSNRETDLRAQLDQVAKQGSGSDEWKNRYEDVRQENEELHRELITQQKVTDEVRQEAVSFLNEMKAISDRSGQNWEREEKLIQQVHRLEEEVSEWKARYAKARTQLRSLRTTSMALSLQQPEVGQFAKDGSVVRPDGLVRDVHVTKFQIAIDEVLRAARVAEPQTIIDSMKSVVAAVRDICKEIPDSASPSDETAQEMAKLRANVSATANNFITASKNFAQSNGVSPISLLDAAASHLSAAVVELVRTVKIRPTPPEELEEDEKAAMNATMNSGLGASRNAYNRRSSITESVYSSRTSGQQPSPPTNVTTPRFSREKAMDYSSRRPPSRNGQIPTKGPDTTSRPVFGIPPMRDNDVEDLKLFLEDRTEGLVQSIQSLVSSIRTVDEPSTVHGHIDSMAQIVGNIVKETQRVIDKTGNAQLRDQAGPVVRTLSGCRARLLAADDDGKSVQSQEEWKEHIGTLPPIAFEIARETKELVQRVDRVGEAGQDSDDFR